MSSGIRADRGFRIHHAGLNSGDPSRFGRHEAGSAYFPGHACVRFRRLDAGLMAGGDGDWDERSRPGG